MIHHAKLNRERRHFVTSRKCAAGVLVAAIASATIPFTEANAQRVCLPRNELGRQLERAYSERPLAYGVTNDGALLEIFSTRDGLTWTLIVTLASGQSCVLATGDSWTTLPTNLIGEQRT